MKRIQLIAAALCLVMLLTVGAGVVAAQDENLRHAGESQIYFYDVKATETHGTGKLQIDTAKHTFVFNGKGFTPDAMIELKGKAAGDTDFKVFATGQVTPSGNLHIAGTWETGAALPGEVATGYQAIGSFTLWNGGAFVAQLKAYYSQDNGVTWIETPDSKAVKGITYYRTGYAPDTGLLGVPDGALVRIHAVVVAGNDRTGSEVFVSDPHSYTAWTAMYEIQGTTLTSKLIYDGYGNAGFPPDCDPSGCVG